MDPFLYDILELSKYSNLTYSRKNTWISAYVRHLSSLTSDIICRCQQWQMTDTSHQYGCLQKRLWKCSNIVEKLSWFDHYVRNESQYTPLAYFPLYRVSHKKSGYVWHVIFKCNFLFLLDIFESLSENNMVSENPI